jgi:hypothetical protein
MASEENPVVKAALDILPLYGIECWRNNQVRVPGRRFTGRKGVGDVIGFTSRAVFVSVEGKKPGGKPSGEQIEFADLVISRGGIALTVQSVDELVQDLEKLRSVGVI